MRKTIVIASILFSFTLACFGQDQISVLWQKGNDYYTKKIYDSAVICFEQIAALKPHKADVYYNLGNTYYRLNKIGPAVLNYERALKIDPYNKEAKDNLILTQNRIANHIQSVNDIFFVNWWDSITHPIKASSWSIFALVVFIAIIVVSLLRRFNNSIGSKLPVQLFFILGFVWLCTIVIAIVSSIKMVQNTGGVVMQNETPLMNIDLKGKPITQLPEGTKVNIVDEKDAWVEVRIPEGGSVGYNKH